MDNRIKCPQCGTAIEISEALKIQIKEESKAEIEQNLRQKIENEKKLEVEELQRILKEKDEKVEEMRNREIELREKTRELEEKEKDIKLETQRQIDEERKRIEEETIKRMSDEHYLKDLEKEKKISDMEKLVEELKRKAQQGSMQTQGEVLELDLEETLRKSFPDDEIMPVAKGELGADIRQIVKTPKGTLCGVILWESKRTKAWSEEWLEKLKKDLRADKANIPAIISETMPKEIKNGLGLKDNVWVCKPGLIIPLAMLLRKTLIDAAREKFISQNKQGKAEEIYSYVTNHEFTQQIEAMVEAYLDMKSGIDKERVVYEKTWKQREMQINKLLSGLANVYGSLQGIAGTALPQIRNLELPTGE